MANASGGESRPKTFFLNEKQELTSFLREGGGRAAAIVPIDWQRRSSSLSESFRAAAFRPQSRDPSAGRHSFVLAVPAAAVEKESTSKKAQAQGGRLSSQPAFGGRDSHLFRKLGLDLIETLPEGVATVHVPAERVPQLLATMNALASASAREQSRWINLDSFRELPASARVDGPWLHSISAAGPVPASIRFQPTLSRTEVQDSLQAIVAHLSRESRLVRAGREFSGRYWCSGILSAQDIAALADDFISIQSIHPPFPVASAGASTGKKRARKKPATSSDNLPQPAEIPPLPANLLPTVAVIDTGIPESHALLGGFRRGGYRNPDLDPSIRYVGDHGSTVASCVVFGRVHMDQALAPPLVAACRVFDVMLAKDHNLIDDDAIVPAIEAVVGTAPDVRVSNLSFSRPSLRGLNPVERREHLLRLQDLENQAFARDLLIVFAAGNSQPGLIPSEPYPNHVDDDRWALGAFACSFNGIVCGAYVDKLNDDAVAGVLGAPSPFTRIGPGLCDSPVPGFSAPGGDSSSSYERLAATGVWVCNASGLWEDHAGTSVAAPLVARETAWVLQELLPHCPPEAAPFAGTIKAWLNLVAKRPLLNGAFERLASRTLGRGFPSASELRSPRGDSAVFVWQTTLQGPKTVSRVQFPVPAAWIRSATNPWLRVVGAWNAPVNAALTESWACRKVGVKVRPFGGDEALVGGGTAKGAYPLIDRSWGISTESLASKNLSLSDAYWILECEYEEVGEYPPAMTVSPQQRVGVVIELLDRSENPTSPQYFIQSLAIAAELTRLSVPQYPATQPVTLKV